MRMHTGRKYNLTPGKKNVWRRAHLEQGNSLWGWMGQISEHLVGNILWQCFRMRCGHIHGYFDNLGGNLTLPLYHDREQTHENRCIFLRANLSVSQSSYKWRLPGVGCLVWVWWRTRWRRGCRAGCRRGSTRGSCCSGPSVCLSFDRWWCSRGLCTPLLGVEKVKYARDESIRISSGASLMTTEDS